jgi:hypothetical protein
MAKKTKLPADTNKRAKAIVDLVTGEEPAQPIDPIKAAAAALGRKGGLVGGKARAKALTAKQRSEIAQKAAAKRWGKKK